MSGLVLKLGPNERILINGAVIENGNRRSRLNIMTPGANILRLRDAIHPDDTNTPVRRLCYTAQLILSGDVTFEDAKHELTLGIDQLSFAMRDQESQKSLAEARAAVAREQSYYVLKHLRQLLDRETQLLGVAAE